MSNLWRERTFPNLAKTNKDRNATKEHWRDILNKWNIAFLSNSIGRGKKTHY